MAGRRRGGAGNAEGDAHGRSRRRHVLGGGRMKQQGRLLVVGLIVGQLQELRREQLHAS